MRLRYFSANLSATAERNAVKVYCFDLGQVHTTTNDSENFNLKYFMNMLMKRKLILT